MNRDRLYELLVVFSLIGAFALIVAVSAVGDSHGLSFKVPRGDAWS